MLTNMQWQTDMQCFHCVRQCRHTLCREPLALDDVSDVRQHQFISRRRVVFTTYKNRNKLLVISRRRARAVHMGNVSTRQCKDEVSGYGSQVFSRCTIRSVCVAMVWGWFHGPWQEQWIRSTIATTKLKFPRRNVRTMYVSGKGHAKLRGDYHLGVGIRPGRYFHFSK